MPSNATLAPQSNDPRSPLRPCFSRVNSRDGPAPLVRIATQLFKQAEPDPSPGIFSCEPQYLNVEPEPITPPTTARDFGIGSRYYASEEASTLDDPSGAYYTGPYEGYASGEGSPFSEETQEDDSNVSSPVSEFSDEWDQGIEWRGEQGAGEQDGGSGTVTPTTPAIVAKLDDLASNIRSLSVWDTNEGEISIEEAHENIKDDIEEEKGQFYSEFEIVTNPAVYRYKYLIVPEDALDGVYHLARAAHGFFNLKHYSSLPDTLRCSNPDSWKFWQRLEEYSIDNEDWHDPILKRPSFFNQHATLVFIERPGMFSRGGDPIYEFIGNFYVRRHDAMLAKKPPRSGSFEQALFDLPYLSASLVILQFVEEPCIH
ncbi:hypothetical protein MD484_g6840, partial [Candolleomyces efflorescens]